MNELYLDNVIAEVTGDKVIFCLTANSELTFSKIMSFFPGHRLGSPYFSGEDIVLFFRNVTSLSKEIIEGLRKLNAYIGGKTTKVSNPAGLRLV